MVDRRKRVALRVLVGGFGAALTLAGLWVSAISLIVGIVPQSPNPFVIDGDPCCGVPDTWAETRVWAFWGWLWLGVALIPLITGLLIVVGAARDRPPRWRRIPTGVGAVVAVAAAAIVIRYLLLGDAPEVVRCRALLDAARTGAAASAADAGGAPWPLGHCGLDGGTLSPAARDVLDH